MTPEQFKEVELVYLTAMELIGNRDDAQTPEEHMAIANDKEQVLVALSNMVSATIGQRVRLYKNEHSFIDKVLLSQMVSVT